MVKRWWSSGGNVVVKWCWSHAGHVVVLSLQVIKAALQCYAFRHHFVHACIYYLALSILNLHYSMLAIYVPMTHPERQARSDGLLPTTSYSLPPTVPTTSYPLPLTH